MADDLIFPSPSWYLLDSENNDDSKLSILESNDDNALDFGIVEKGIISEKQPTVIVWNNRGSNQTASKMFDCELTARTLNQGLTDDGIISGQWILVKSMFAGDGNFYPIGSQQNSNGAYESVNYSIQADPKAIVGYLDENGEYNLPDVPVSNARPVYPESGEIYGIQNDGTLANSAGTFAKVSFALKPGINAVSNTNGACLIKLRYKF